MKIKEFFKNKVAFCKFKKITLGEQPVSEFTLIEFKRKVLTTRTI